MEKKQKKEYIQIIILSVLIFAFGISIIFTSAISKGIKSVLFKADIRTNNDLVVHFIDIGQGDAIAIKFANEQIMLIDSGPKISQNYLIEYIQDNVICSDNDLTIDYVLLTHPDIDHSGGMSAVFAEFDVLNFFRPNIASESESVSDFASKSNLDEYNELIVSSKQEKGLKTNIINQNYEFNIGDALVQIFAPLKVYDTSNEMSPVVKISYLDKSFLFTGDLEKDAEQDMINKYGDILNADVLKVAHHGSANSTSVEFVQAVTPTYAIICVGGNSYGHPSFATIENLENAGAKVLTTEENSIRLVCAKDMFGVLNQDVTHSYEFVDWWIIALVFEVVFIAILIKVIIKVVKNKKNDTNID